MMIKETEKRTVKFITVFIIAFALLLPAGEAFAAGTLKLGSRTEVARLQELKIAVISTFGKSLNTLVPLLRMP